MENRSPCQCPCPSVKDHLLEETPAEWPLAFCKPWCWDVEMSWDIVPWNTESLCIQWQQKRRVQRTPQCPLPMRLFFSWLATAPPYTVRTTATISTTVKCLAYGVYCNQLWILDRLSNSPDLRCFEHYLASWSFNCGINVCVSNQSGMQCGINS